MKKQLLVVLFCASCTFGYSQTTKLTVHNPLQRVGDRLSVSYTIDPTVKEEDENTNIKPEPRTCRTVDNSLGRGSFMLTKEFDKVGDYTIGPFRCFVEGKLYETNTLTLKVYPKLPNRVVGVWVNYINFDNGHYIVIENREVRKENHDPYNFNRDDKTSVQLVDSLFNSEDKEAIRHSISTSSGRFDGIMYTQKTHIYKIWLSSDYDNSFILKEEHLKNIPENTTIEPVLVTKPLF